MFSHAQAPIRIGIAGGGTDLPAWTHERQGRCLSLAIAVYTHAVAITRPDGQVVASYNHLDRATCATEIGNGLVRESALMHGFEDGFEVHTLSEVSSHGSGLGVSSSIAVSLTACFSRLREMLKGVDVKKKITKENFARDAWIVEINRLHRSIGRQDHMAAVYGGLHLYSFNGDSASVEYSFSDDDAKWVADHLLLVRLPEGHDSRTILSGVKKLDQVRVSYDAVDVAVQAIEMRDVNLLGDALSMCQRSKLLIPGAVTKSVSEVVESVSVLPSVYGCKVAGAGGGGHVVVACELSAIENIKIAVGLPVLRVEPDFFGVRSGGWR